MPCAIFEKKSLPWEMFMAILQKRLRIANIFGYGQVFPWENDL